MRDMMDESVQPPDLSESLDALRSVRAPLSLRRRLGRADPRCGRSRFPAGLAAGILGFLALFGMDGWLRPGSTATSRAPDREPLRLSVEWQTHSEPEIWQDSVEHRLLRELTAVTRSER